MLEEQLLELVADVQAHKTEKQHLELKKAAGGVPKKLYDTLSSFSNQDGGGIILFGIDETNNFEAVGVYDPHHLQKMISEACQSMQPKIRPLITVAEKNGKFFVAAEIPGLDPSDRPCFYTGPGRINGSYVRVGDSDRLMTEYEIYSYEAFRQKRHDEVRTADQALIEDLSPDALETYIQKLKRNKANLSQLENSTIYRLMSILKDGKPTLAALLLFGLYPQAFFPQLCIFATVIPGLKVGSTGIHGERFTDNERIEGTLPEMIERAIAFVQRNIRISTIIDPDTGERRDRTEYPVDAIREAILNAVVHRDYSHFTENQPIQLQIFHDRIEITNPGGLYGRMTIDKLGHTQPDTRNPILVSALELLGVTENRYSGIPVMIEKMTRMGLEAPVFRDTKETFSVTFLSASHHVPDSQLNEKTSSETKKKSVSEKILDFCITPKNRKEIADHLGMNSSSYMAKRYLLPLLQSGKLSMTLPDKPRSHSQKYIRT